MRSPRPAPLLLAAIVAACCTALTAEQSSEELAKRQYANGVDLLRSRKFVEALRDFQAVVDAYPASSVADDALLEMARYHLDETHDYEKAQSTIDTLIKTYPTSDAAPFGYVLDGQVALTRGRRPADIDRALGSFQRVPRMFPESQAVPPAMLARGDTLRITGNCAEATEQYATLTLSYPRSRWAFSANEGASRCLVAQGRALDAMTLLQEAVSSAPGEDLAARARDSNTILYRLYIRPPQPAFVVSETSLTGPSGRLRDVSALWLRGGMLFGVGDGGVTVFDLANDGRVVRTEKIEDVRGTFTTADGRTGFYSSKAVHLEGQRLETFSVLKADKSRRVLEDITAVAALSTGELLVGESSGPPTVHRFGRDLQLLPGGFQARADRLAVGGVDQIASLDRSERSIGLWTREGRPAGRLAPKGSGWQFDQPVDIAFDVFDHLYVLDRGAGTVWVFLVGPSPRLLTAFTLPERAPGAFRRATALALDAAGRLFIYDDRAERVQVYQ